MGWHRAEAGWYTVRAFADGSTVRMLDSVNSVMAIAVALARTSAMW
jgi:hypothetical protein